MHLVFACVCGLLMGLGLVLSGLTNPAKVLAFLDIGGQWDPSLLLVFAAAIAVTAPLYARLKRRGRTLTAGAPLQWPTAWKIDKRLLAGALIFGLGWGLAGMSPVSAVLNAAQGYEDALTFALAMLVGMGAFSFWQKPTSDRHR
ncbi:DUF6691 family protein [Bordetella genomosp. 12]|uniref:YeeE/YedE family protein n=1 Tax=Bordetella genomosp. 12 TaxID=463035 RepID=A0A261VD73_9BORD|nr:DUF6691 family protein [Bordetella genomosp. 12]OZI72084.1 hypothetical protein CAL22_20140 [Bordetella genomosp. 12]